MEDEGVDLALLIARDQIRELSALYCHRIALCDVAGVVELFTEDGAMEVSGVVHQGHDALTKLYEDSLAVRLIPYIHNHVVRVSGDTAEAELSAEIVPIEPEGMPVIRGWYADEYRRVGSDWKFVFRKFNAFTADDGES